MQVIRRRVSSSLLTALLISACSSNSIDSLPATQVSLSEHSVPVGLQQPLPSLAPMLKRVSPAVVNIATEGRVKLDPDNPLLKDPFFRRFFKDPDNLQRRTSSLGSGVIIDSERGFIVTNYHVIENADDIAITLADGRYFSAEMVGVDREADIALMRIAARDLTALALADSDRVQVGDFVAAIGNPFGLGQSVTSGIVSGLGRSGLGAEGYEDFIQTDASINPGNSGGALVNLNGDLVGLNTAILAPSGGNIGISFAIPANMVRRSIEQLIRFGRVSRGQLGVSVRDLDQELAQRYGLERRRGAVIVAVVPNSAAALAGLQQGDVVLTVNGRVVRDANALRNAIGRLNIGARLEVDVLRDGRPLRVSTQVGQRPTKT